MDEKKYEASLELLMHAGNAESDFLAAVEAAREFNFEEADKLIKSGEKELQEAHSSQFAMLQKEAKGESVEVDIILVHAQDHLSMALSAKSMAEEMIYLYRFLKEHCLKGEA